MTGKPRKKSEIIHIRSVLPSLLKTFRPEDDMSLNRVWDLWATAVGPVVAENTRPAAFKGKLLLVNATSSSWVHQLQFLKEDLIRKVNDALGEDLVEEVRFKIGPV